MSGSAVVDAAHSALETLSVLLTAVAGGLAPALAIVLLTVLVRLVLSPLTYLQLRGEQRRAALAPQVEELRDRHRADPVALAAEILALHRANGAGPFRGLLPALAQAPFFMVMYQVALHPPAGAIAGVALTAHLGAGWPVFAVLMLAAAAAGWWSSRRLGPAAPGLLRYLPYLTVAMVAWLPLAGGLYLASSALWTVLERAVGRRLLPR